VTNFDKELEGVEWRSLAKSVSLDLWVCRQFGCLPTEERFYRLTAHQKLILFYGYLESPTDEQLHMYHNQEQVTAITEDTEKDFKGLGYSAEQIERIKENIKAAGLT